VSTEGHTIRRRLMAALVFAAAAAPAAAQARPDLNFAPTVALTSAVAPPAAPATRPIAVEAGAAFQWRDAGIGAAGAALLLGAGGSTGAIATRRRKRAAVSG
jgi:hypothetical protein